MLDGYLLVQEIKPAKLIMNKPELLTLLSEHLLEKSAAQNYIDKAKSLDKWQKRWDKILIFSFAGLNPLYRMPLDLNTRNLLLCQYASTVYLAQTPPLSHRHKPTATARYLKGYAQVRC